MPKKIPRKGKQKHAVEESDDSTFRRLTGDNEEEYTTVVDFEEHKKYNKRLIESNWAKYELAEKENLEIAKEENDLPKTDDFNYLIKTASSDCSHFQFSSEKQWQSENNMMLSSNLFNLDLNILSSGLACVPFYKRIGLDESELSVEDKEKFDKEANESLNSYKLLREKLTNKSETDSKVKQAENNLKNLEESVKNNLDLGESRQKSEEKVSLGVGEGANTAIKEVDIFVSKDCSNDKTPKSKQKIFFSETENLEDWLDSVLDD